MVVIVILFFVRLDLDEWTQMTVLFSSFPL